MSNTTSYEFSILKYFGAEVTGDTAYFYYDDFAAEVIWYGLGQFTIELYAMTDVDPDEFPTIAIGVATTADQAVDTVHALAEPFVSNPAAIERAVAMKFDRTIAMAL